MRKIKQISIKHLFGIFHYDIMLNMDERVTIIHSPKRIRQDRDSQTPQ
ncbi:MAG TPA: hypothetical protein VGD98_17595 [Ktedonobacteraceae bacterium]